MMKFQHKPKKLPLLAALCIVFFCVSASFAQIKTGGYKTVDVSDAGVAEAAEFVVRELGRKDEIELSLESVERAERQVVAGTNYRLCLLIRYPAQEEDEEEIVSTMQVVVFRSLKNEFNLKSWKEVDGDCQ